ncbi:two-component hybrid sensor and regulator [Labilithrix luteola]|uniref:histidine kinase n=2 Tax=Labilithrix luteola TaxID=1391654 RepID=A0A0K1PZ18_9BACT|nr:two-component hybrid sensor and regulator [Labilithrix luteola]
MAGVAAVAIGVVVFVADAFAPLNVAIAVLHVAVVLLSASAWNRRGIQATSLVCLGATLLAYAIAHSHEFSPHAFGRLLLSLSAISITAFLTLKGQAATQALVEQSESLRRSEAFLADTQRLSQTGSFSFKAPSGDMYWSDEAARIYGYEPTVPPTMERVLARVCSGDRAIVRGAFDQALRGDGPIDVRHRLRMPDGETKYVHVLARTIWNRDGECEYLGAVTDVTKATRAEQALHHSRTELAHATRVSTLGQLAASISHEVSQPLSAVNIHAKACLRWLNRPEPELAEVHNTLARILEATGRATQVVARIRSLARKGEPNHVVLDLNELARETLLLVQRELQTQDVTLRVELTNDRAVVHGDRIQLQQVLINLLMNGMQAMRGGTGESLLVLRTVIETEGDVTLTVSDTGPGVAPENEARLFEPFFTTKSDGMGMGLSICRSIVEAHHGCLRLRNDPRITKGATLALTLPPYRSDIATPIERTNVSSVGAL